MKRLRELIFVPVDQSEKVVLRGVAHVSDARLRSFAPGGDWPMRLKI